MLIRFLFSVTEKIEIKLHNLTLVYISKNVKLVGTIKILVCDYLTWLWFVPLIGREQLVVICFFCECDRNENHQYLVNICKNYFLNSPSRPGAFLQGFGGYTCKKLLSF